MSKTFITTRILRVTQNDLPVLGPVLVRLPVRLPAPAPVPGPVPVRLLELVPVVRNIISDLMHLCIPLTGKVSYVCIIL